MLDRIAPRLAPVAVVAAALLAVFAPPPPSAWATIGPGALLLACAPAFWWVDEQRTRRTLAIVVGIAAVDVGGAFDARPAQLMAAAAILSVALLRTLRRPQA